MYYTLDILLETCEEYKSKYDKRLKDFLAEFEAEPEDFDKRELDFFEHTLIDLKSGGDFLTGITNYEDAMNVIEILGWEKFKYATLCKIRFLSGELSNANRGQNANIKVEQQLFSNNFDSISPEDIFTHFKRGLVEKGYFEETELIEYLKTAFELKKKPAILFKLKHRPSKEKIYLVFYTYYKDIAGKPHTRQNDYVELLGNYFEGFDNSIIRTNWSRRYKVGRK